MTSTNSSPIPAIDMLVRHLPLSILQSGVNIAMKNVASNHAGAFERMGDSRYKYLIVPKDMSVGFVFEPIDPCPKMRVVKNPDDYKKDVITSYSIHYTKLYEDNCD